MNPEYRNIKLRNACEKELTFNILPFWAGRMKDTENGGFYGRISGENQLIQDAPKGGILNARILWTFSAAYRALGKKEYLDTAQRAKNYLFQHFADKEFGGTYWEVDSKGNPLDTKKQIYSQAFCIYALSEYFRATGEQESLDFAIELFQLIEQYSFDPEYKGYFEAYSRDWKLLDDLRLSDKDANEKKTMNTHLHILEAYTNLYRVWKDAKLSQQLRGLIEVFFEHIVNKKTWHLNLFFDEFWTLKSSDISYGHDIECSWLLFEAAEVLGDEEILKKAGEVCINILRASLEGLQPDNSLLYEMKANGHTDTQRHWWVQAEAVVGLINGYELTGDKLLAEKAGEVFHYIIDNLVDKQNGEWYWGVYADGSINKIDDKAGFWKCPYHNSRMCLEVMRRAENITAKQ
ncbi:MAG TPA: AGE family epimerase/isomerase [Bacteroidales bacterium]|nr:AGE family epimerase/isomerase [Bacteroidales bacterium]